jgi:hypothetical protein
MKLKKAEKIIKKAKKKDEKRARKNDFRMYENAGCFACSSGQKYSGGGDACSVTYYERCKCANKKTERYKKFILDRDKLMTKMTAKEFEILEFKWYDNNSHITEGNNAVSRSW